MKSTVFILSLAFLVSLLILGGCVKTGEPGPAGTDGTTGANGLGFTKAIRDGNVLVFLDGKTPQGTSFKDTLDFKFSAGDLSYSSATQNPDWKFNLRRFLYIDSYDVNDDLSDYIDMQLEPRVFEGDTIFDFTGRLRATATTADYRYFKIDDYYYNTDGSNFTNESFTGYKYDTNTGHLYYRFSLTSPSTENGIGQDLNISGVVDVTVYK